MDAVIEAAAAAMRFKHPGGRPSMVQVVERAMASASRDRQVADAKDRKERGPMRFVAEGEASGIVLPRGAAKAKGGGPQ